MTRSHFDTLVSCATSIFVEPCSGTNHILVSKAEAMRWADAQVRGRVLMTCDALFIGVQYWEGEPIEPDPQSSHGPSDRQPEYV